MTIVKHVIVETIPAQHGTIQDALKFLKEKDPEKEVVLLAESTFGGVAPLLLGAPGLRPAAIMRISILPLALSSTDTAPFGLGILPDSSPEGKIRNIALNEKIQKGAFGSIQALMNEILQSLGARPSPYFILDGPTHLADRAFQSCPPSLEYPRSDAPKTLKFLGGIPRGLPDPWTHKPEWWSEISENKDKKKIIGVCQGTLAINLNDLVTPTLAGLKDRKDIIVVVLIGKKGGKLPQAISAPENARVWDYIPFGEILAHADIFITNGGYGAFQHSVGCGVPLIIAGDTEEKFEISNRGEWAGVAVNLKTGKPTPQQIEGAVDEILANPKYKIRAQEIQEEMKGYDPVGVMVDNIYEVLAEKKNALA